MMHLDYTIVRSSKRKKLTITVERDRRVIVHAPSGASDETIYNAVENKRQWLYSKLTHTQKYRDRSHPPGKEVVNGESAPYLGSDYRIEIRDTPSGEVEFAGAFLVPPSHTSKRREVLRSWYLERAREKILARVNQHAKQLGVAFGEAKIVDNRYRWGSCTVQGNVNFNWRLIKAPMFVIDYVVVHELAHLIESNHTSRFWNVVRAATPTMAKAKTWLKDHGQILEDEI